MEGHYISGGVVRFNLAESEQTSRVSEIIGRLLQVRNLSVLLGAGASFHLGSPRIRKIDRAQVDQMITEAGIHCSAEVRGLLDWLVPESVDLERVLQRLTAALGYVGAFSVSDLALGERSFTAEHLREAYGVLNLALASVCELPRPGSGPEALSAHQEFFRKLLGARRSDLPRLKVFTTNYDLVIESALDAIGIQYLDGFRGGVTRRLDLSSFGADVFTSALNNGGSLVRVHELVHLYKMHGSLNWRRAVSRYDLVTSDIVQSSEAPTFDDLAVIYPTPAKDADVLGYPYSDLLRIFGTSLAEPEAALVVAGYGFADDHINRLVGQALRHNPTMQLLIIDPIGVLVDGGTDELTFVGESIAGRLAQMTDNRISVVTGPSAAFADVHALLPDVNPEQPPAHFEAAGILAG